MKTTLRFVLIFVFLNSIVTLTKAQNYALSFNPTNSNYVDCGSNSLLNASNIRTMECWVKLNSLSADGEILSRSVSGVGVELLMFGGNLAFYCMNGSNYAFLSYAGSNLSTGVWYHLAATWDGSTGASLRLYVNGVSVGTLTSAGSLSGGAGNPGVGTSFRIGAWSDAGGGRYLNGTLDEARVWSVTRTAAQIKAGMYGNVPAGTAGLIAYYTMNNGSGSTATNSTTNPGLDGTLVNVPFWIGSPVQWNANALSFDGVDDQAKAPASSAYDLTTGTVEFWAKPSALPVGVNQCMVGVRGTGGARYSFHLSNTAVGMWNGVVFFSVPYSFSTGVWYHLAFVCTGSGNTNIYVNGVSAGSIASGFGTATGQPLVMGIAYNATGTQEPFNGAVDEVRIWNTQQTAAQVSANMNQTLLGSESGLVGLFSMDQGVAAGTNGGEVIAVDGTAAGNHATLANFSLSGASSNWVGHTAISLPVEFGLFTAKKETVGVRLQWRTEQEQNSKEFVVERSGDNLQFTVIGSVDAAGNSSVERSYDFVDRLPVSGKNYYRLRETDLDGKSLYSITVAVSYAEDARVRLSPNPANASVNWWMISPQVTAAVLSVSDLSGRTLISRSVRVLAGANRFTIGVSALPAGAYVMTLREVESGSTTSKEFQIVR